ncbi:MAG: MATE family efflux transporter [Saprospiraceae bacterium]|nr:MATE family efflux transporter [Saprospiraceae bacterium]MBP6566398.1 MATE family efflux transporter [Saprospiraceae bacterium]
MKTDVNISGFFPILKAALKGEERDYTKGSIKLAILLLAVPMILELSLESVFALVDMFFVGKLGQNAIAVVGYTESMITMVYSLSIGLSTAATAIIARRVGEKEMSGASKAAIQALLISLFVSAIISFFGVIYAEKMLAFMGATPEVIEEGLAFTKIMFGFNIVIVLLFLINGIFRGAGNAALAMKSLWIASIFNIILDPLLIYGFGSWQGWGLEGAAIATCIGRGTGVVYQLYHLFYGSGLIKIKWSDVFPDFTIIKSMVSLAWPATFQFIIASGSWIILTRLVADAGGTEASAGYQIAIRNVVFFILPAWGLSNAAATLVGQNLGAGQPQRAEKSVILATKYNAIFMTMVSIIFIFLSPQIISFFTVQVEVQKIGISALQIIGSGFIFYGIGMVMIQSLNGAGDTRTPTWINFVGFWLFQIPLAYYFVTFTDWGLNALFAAIPIAETSIAVMAFIIFRQGKWKKVKV